MVESNRKLVQFIEELTNFQPFNEQEEIDVKSILQYVQAFPDIFSRDNKLIHITSSPWIVNKERTKVLMVYHNIYKSWSWCGGHNDHELDCKLVALKEGKEETGIKDLQLLHPYIFAIDILPVTPHVIKGVFVSAHLHANITYLFEADDTQELSSKLDENSNVAWIPIQEISKYVSEKEMLVVYTKLVNKLMLR